MSDASELVVVRAFSLPHEAHLASSVLYAAGLKTRVADEYIVTADWLMSNAVGGVKVVVLAEDLTTAREVLDTTAFVADDDARQISGAEDSEQDVCPQCGSRALKSVTFGRRISVFTWMFMGFPLFPVWRRWRCDDCGHQSR